MAEEKSGKTMTKADIVEQVYEKVGFSKKESSEVVEMVFETIKKTLEAGDRVKISGFGKFEVRYKKPRRGRNPQTNATIIIPERNVLSFKPSQVLRNALFDETEANTNPPTESDDDGSISS